MDDVEVKQKERERGDGGGTEFFLVEAGNDMNRDNKTHVDPRVFNWMEGTE